MPKKKSKRGGKRNGAGRKKIAVDDSATCRVLLTQEPGRWCLTCQALARGVSETRARKDHGVCALIRSPVEQPLQPEQLPAKRQRTQRSLPNLGREHRKHSEAARVPSQVRRPAGKAPSHSHKRHNAVLTAVLRAVGELPRSIKGTDGAIRAVKKLRRAKSQLEKQNAALQKQNAALQVPTPPPPHARLCCPCLLYCAAPVKRTLHIPLLCRCALRSLRSPHAGRSQWDAGNPSPSSAIDVSQCSTELCNDAVRG